MLAEVYSHFVCPHCGSVLVIRTPPLCQGRIDVLFVRFLFTLFGAWLRFLAELVLCAQAEQMGFERLAICDALTGYCMYFYPYHGRDEEKPAVLGTICCPNGVDPLLLECWLPRSVRQLVVHGCCAILPRRWRACCWNTPSGADWVSK
jgi:hypothetical protein